MPEPKAPNVTADPHWGKGGRYVVIDGKRVPAAAVPVSQPAPAAEVPASTPVQPKKGK